MTKGASVITMTYTADGEKLTKAVTGGGATKNYVGGIEYSGASLEAIYHGEGRCRPNGTTAFFYEYTVKDHLGNARVNFQANGAAIANIEDHHYYPFGMKMEGIGSSTVTNKYTYNYKELNEDFGLNWHDYGARWYDAALGRWWSADPLAEPQANYSPYAYTYNNPLSFIDPTGMMGEGADGLNNDQWLDRTRKDGGYWEQAKKDLTINTNRPIQDLDGNTHFIGDDDLVGASWNAYGTRTYVNDVLIFDSMEGYYVECCGDKNERALDRSLEMRGALDRKAYEDAFYKITWQPTVAIYSTPIMWLVEGVGALAWAGIFGESTVVATAEGVAAKGAVKLLTQFSSSTIDDAVSLVMKDPNKVAHLFPAKHNLGSLVTKLGGQENTVRAVLNAANGKLPTSGVFNNIPVNVGGSTVFIRGNVINGVPRLGTMFIP